MAMSGSMNQPMTPPASAQQPGWNDDRIPWGTIGVSTALGGFGAGLGSYLASRNQNQKMSPVNAAMPYLNKIPETMRPYYEPAINAGNRALTGYQGASERLLNNPNDVLSQLGAGYKESPGYQWNLNQAMQAINNANAAGGTLGTPMNQQMAAETASGLASRDYGDYLNHALSLYGLGMQGEQDIFGKGLNASTDYGLSLANVLNSQAKLAYEGQGLENERKAQGQENLAGGIGQMLPYIIQYAPKLLAAIGL